MARLPALIEIGKLSALSYNRIEQQEERRSKRICLNRYCCLRLPIEVHSRMTRESERASVGGKLSSKAGKTFLQFPLIELQRPARMALCRWSQAVELFFSLFACERWEICSTRKKKRGSVVSTTITIDNWHQASTWLNRWKLNKIRWPVTRQYSKKRAPNSDCFVYFKLFPILPLKWMLSISTAAARVWTKKE